MRNDGRKAAGRGLHKNIKKKTQKNTAQKVNTAGN